MLSEVITLNKERNVTLTAYIQAVGGEFTTVTKRPVILILPGGGYFGCSDQEADPIAFPYLQAGYHVCILRYSVLENAVWPNPLSDFDAAMEYIISKADEWNLYPDKIAVVGFSAGGHLAACAASMAKHRPNAAILGYPVIDKETATGFLPSAPDAADAVDKDTCPCFIFAGRADTTVPVSNSLKMMTALMKYDISYESHIYAYARHGFGICNRTRGFEDTDFCNRVPRWVDDSIEWLKDMLGDFGDGKMTEPKWNRLVNGNHEAFCNMECAVGHIMQNENAMEVLSPYFQTFLDAFHAEEVPGSFQGLYLREFLGMCQVSGEKFGEIEKVLSTIPNIMEIRLDWKNSTTC